MTRFLTPIAVVIYTDVIELLNRADLTKIGPYETRFLACLELGPNRFECESLMQSVMAQTHDNKKKNEKKKKKRNFFLNYLKGCDVVTWSKSFLQAFIHRLISSTTLAPFHYSVKPQLPLISPQNPSTSLSFSLSAEKNGDLSFSIVSHL